jgi:hypothetical protein
MVSLMQTFVLLREAHTQAKLARHTMDETTDERVYALALESERAAWIALDAFRLTYSDQVDQNGGD